MKTILYAEDDVRLRGACQHELEDEGYRVLTAEDGNEAISVVRQQRPDLVILDICMPNIDGLEAAQRIKEIDGEIPIVFYTAFDEDCLRDPRSRNAIACVEKSAGLAELKHTIFAIFSNQPQYRVGLPPEVNG
jgi:CheY-like chemotaxis protein